MLWQAGTIFSERYNGLGPGSKSTRDPALKGEGQGNVGEKAAQWLCYQADAGERNQAQEHVCAADHDGHYKQEGDGTPSHERQNLGSSKGERSAVIGLAKCRAEGPRLRE